MFSTLIMKERFPNTFLSFPAKKNEHKLFISKFLMENNGRIYFFMLKSIINLLGNNVLLQKPITGI